MPRLGSHLSIAGGLHNALEAAVELECDALNWIFRRIPPCKYRTEIAFHLHGPTGAFLDH